MVRRDALAGDQFAEQDAERIDIGGGADRRLRELFGCGIGRCECPQGASGGIAGVFIEQPGDSEIEQLDVAFGRHQHVGWFQVAMDDERAMRRLDRVADDQEQLQTLAQAHLVFVHVMRDGLAIDQFQHDIGEAAVGDATFDQTGDARMAQARQRLALPSELFLRLGGIQAARQQLDGDFLTYTLELAKGPEHGGRTAFTQHLDQFERADPAACREGCGNAGIADGERGVGGIAGRQQLAAGSVGREQFFDLGAEQRVGAVPGKPLLARHSRQLYCRLEQLAQCRCGIHAGPPLRNTLPAINPIDRPTATPLPQPMRALMKARAKRQSRSIVRRTSPRVSPTCCRLNPAK